MMIDNRPELTSPQKEKDNRITIPGYLQQRTLFTTGPFQSKGRWLIRWRRDSVGRVILSLLDLNTVSKWI